MLEENIRRVPGSEALPEVRRAYEAGRPPDLSSIYLAPSLPSCAPASPTLKIAPFLFKVAMAMKQRLLQLNRWTPLFILTCGTMEDTPTVPPL
jgi:hypothetical protein